MCSKDDLVAKETVKPDVTKRKTMKYVKGSVAVAVAGVLLHYFGKLGLAIKILEYLGVVAFGFLISCKLMLFTGSKYVVDVKEPFDGAAHQEVLAERYKEYEEIWKRESRKQPLLISRNVDAIVHEIIELINRDFVLWWYEDLVAKHEHVLCLIREELWQVLMNFKERLRKMDEVKFFTNDLICRIYNHFQKIRYSSGNQAEKTPFILSPFLISEARELEYLRQMSNFLLVLLLPSKYARCQPVRHLLREIFACKVVYPTVEMICDPDYINRKLVQYLKRQQAELEQHTKTYTYAKTFEDFVSMINQCIHIEDLKIIRYNIMTEILQATTINNLKRSRGIDQDKESVPQTTSKGDLLQARNLKRYINQLRTAKTLCEKRVKNLGGPDYSSSAIYGKGSEYETSESMPGRTVLSFSVIMESSHCRRYFSKYLEKEENHSLLRFWEDVEEMKQADKTFWHQFGNEIYQLYVNNVTANVKLSKNILKGMEAFMMANKGPESFFQAQEEVYVKLEERFYHSFLVSELYNRMLAQAEKEGIDFSQCPEEPNDSREDEDCKNSHICESSGEGLSLSDYSNCAKAQMRQLDEKLSNKTQALQALRSTPKSDPKMMLMLEKEIDDMKAERHQLECHIDRTETWSENLGMWQATLDKAEISKDSEKLVPQFTLLVHLTGGRVPRKERGISGWVVLRTVADFHSLQQKLIPAALWVKKIELPSQNKPRFKTFDKTYLDRAKALLQNFLTVVMKDDQLNKSEALYSFLSPSPDHLKRSLPPPKKPKFSLSQFFKNTAGTGQTETTDDEDLLLLYDVDSKEDKKDSIAEPLYLLVGEIFELRGVFNWFRRSLIAFVQITSGKTINRQIHETVAHIISEPMLEEYLKTFKDSMWPDGVLSKVECPRSDAEKQQTRDQAKQLLLTSIPEMLSDLVGQQNARKGMAKVFEALQDRRLNKQLLYDILETFIFEFCPELKTPLN
ncbi:sorting nexin snazarus isoform X1 [Tachypleus tridentatus]|uniref:sorting nexin snazarus isoform X1 n=1 Tax=Tachypleus tridentatus TaxID=6853 RepID=UPI003FD653F4